MKIKIIILYIALILCKSSLFSQSKSILFIGNSYTYYNEGLPTALKNIATSFDQEISTEMIAPGGFSFQSHSTNQTSLDLINSRNWDYVVLQEQSQKPSFPPSQVANEVYPYAESLCNTIRQNDICSQIIFFMTWGHKYGDQSNCQNYQPLCTYQGMQWRLRQSYVEMAENNDAWLSPVGMAFAKIIETNPEIELYSADNSHPSVYGTYLAACTFYSTIFHKSPVGSTYISSGINVNQAEILQNAAWSVFADSLDTWNIDTTKLRVDFEYLTLLSNTESYFLNSSQNADSCYWQFGDDEDFWQYDMNELVTHLYPESGNYEVCLTAYKGNCDSEKICKNYYISIDYSLIDENSAKNKINIYPNPSSDGIIFIENAKNKSCSIIDLSGRIICKKELENQKLNLSDLSKGIYFIEIDSKIYKIHLK